MDLEKRLNGYQTKEKTLSDECDKLVKRLNDQTLMATRLQAEIKTKSEEIYQLHSSLDAVKDELKKERSDKSGALVELKKQLNELEKTKLRLEHELETERATSQVCANLDGKTLFEKFFEYTCIQKSTSGVLLNSYFLFVLLIHIIIIIWLAVFRVLGKSRKA